MTPSNDTPAAPVGSQEFRYFKDADGRFWRVPTNGRLGHRWDGTRWVSATVNLKIINIRWRQDGTIETDAHGTPLAEKLEPAPAQFSRALRGKLFGWVGKTPEEQAALDAANAETPAPAAGVPAHKRVFEYDGAFRCLDCGAEWGALPGHPVMPERCDRKPADQPPSEGASPRVDAAFARFIRDHDREALKATMLELACELADEKRGRESARVTFNEDLRVMKEFADRKESESAGLREALTVARDAFTSITEIRWGHDGDCGARVMAECGIDAINDALDDGHEALAGKEAAGE